MERMFEDMMDYLSSVSKEQLSKDWESIKDLNEVGPLMSDVIDDAIANLQINAIVISEISVNCNNPYYQVSNSLHNNLAA